MNDSSNSEELNQIFQRFHSIFSRSSLSLPILLIDPKQPSINQKQNFLKLFHSSSSIFLPSLWLNYLEVLPNLYIKTGSANAASMKATIAALILKVIGFLQYNEKNFSGTDEELCLLKIHLEYVKLLT